MSPLFTGQSEIDYVQAAQQRAAADTGLLEKRATVTVLAGDTSVVLPDEVLQIEAVYNGATALQLIPTVEYMRLATGTPITISDTPLYNYFVVVARTLYVWPSSGQDIELTLYYSFRPAAITSSSTFELTGSAKRLVERLASAYMLFDDGQPELGQQELVAYQTDAKRLAKRNRSAWGGGGSLALAGRRRAPG